MEEKALIIIFVLLTYNIVPYMYPDYPQAQTYLLVEVKICCQTDYIKREEAGQLNYTVNIYRYKTIEANANTGEIQLPGNPSAPTWKSFSPYSKLP